MLKAIRSFIKKKKEKRKLISPRLALVCAYLFEVVLLVQSLSVPTAMGGYPIWANKVINIAMLITCSSQIICTVRACFAKPKTWLRKSVFWLAMLLPFLFAISNLFVGYWAIMILSFASDN